MLPANRASGYSIDIRFEEIKLPPFQEILVLGRNSPHGKMGILKSFEMLAPDGFEVVEPDTGLVEAVFINKRILKKVQKEVVLRILTERVFPFISEGELLKVDFKVTVFHHAIEISAGT
jgi:hypothetical protein